MRASLFATLFYCFSLIGNAQELPPVVSFDNEDYQAGSQNWMVSQGEEHFIYAANNRGLLEFNGRHWTLHPSPNESIMRSVKAHNGRVYTGSYMDFGYWSRREDGRLSYQSLSPGSLSQMVPDEQFWNIFIHESFVVFQSLHQFFLYQPATDKVEVIAPPNGISKVYLVGEALYFSDHRQQLFRLESGEVVSIFTAGVPAFQIVHLWEEDQQLLAQTASNGCFALRDGGIQPLPGRHPFLSDKRVYSAISLRGGGQVFGTISNGLFITDDKGLLRYQIDQIAGLTNNTILSLLEDADNNVWAGTDNGISCVNLHAPIRKFTDNTGQLGTVYASAVYQGDLYLGSNQGLFVKRKNAKSPFRLVEGTRGQVWSLFLHDGKLFCGHDAGTFMVSERQVRPVSAKSGTWAFLAIPGRPDLLLQGGYYGLAVLERQDGQWQLRNEVEGFDYSTRFLGFRPGPEIYVSHEYQGVYGLKLDEDFRAVLEQKAYDFPPKGKGAGLAGFRDSIFYLSRDGLSVLKDYDRGFRQVTELDGTLPAEDYSSGNMTSSSDRLWFFTRQGINFFKQGALINELQRQMIPIASELINAKAGYENITEIGHDSLLLGSADGYLVLALETIPEHEHELHLTKVLTMFHDHRRRHLPTDNGEDVPYDGNNLTFSFAVPSYSKYFQPVLQYRLVGYQDKWSGWSPVGPVSFPGLPYGDYTLEARSMLGQRLSDNTIVYSFTILRPWYATYLALGLYVLGGLLLTYLFHRAYTRYYHKKQRLWKAENERKIAAQQRETELALSKVNNEQLQRDIANKNREMATSTMSLVRKNELLQQIKDNLLTNQEPKQSIKEVIETIDRNIDEAETWNLFKTAFENADREFFKKVKDLHPGLSPNDLKLCAYLRLNLSSKEIAPMLNISPRSVEVKRYRLRKKLDLDAKAGLVEYIMDI